jgi:uncharacterized membrane protein
MTALVFTRLLFSVELGLLLAGLGWVFLPTTGVIARLIRNHYIKVLFAVAALTAVYWWLFAVLRYWSMRTAGVDLGYFANILWTTVHGNILAAAISGGSSFGWHFSPSLALLAIPYAVWQDPLWLMGMQALFTASGAIALAMAAGRLGLSRLAAMLVALLWLFSPILRGAMFYDFHEIGMVAGCAAWAVYLAVRGRIAWALVLALVAMGFKEDAPIYIGCLGVILVGSYKKPAAGWWMLAIAVVYYLAVQLCLWDWLAPNHRDYISVRFPHIAENGDNLLGSIIGNPMLLFANLWEWDRLWGLFMLFMPVMFLPLLRWGSIGLLPALWLILSMSVFSPYMFTLHYAAPLLALIIIACIPSLKKLLGAGFGWQRYVGYLALGFTISLTLAQPPLVVFTQFNPVAWRPHPHLGMIEQVAANTGSGESLTASKFIAPYFTRRMVFKEFPSNLLTDDFYLSASAMGCPQMLMLIGDLGYRNLFDDSLYWFLSRRGNLDPRQQFLERMRWMDAECCTVQEWNLKPDAKASRGTALYIAADNSWGGNIVTTPELILPPGNYGYRIRLRTDERSSAGSNVVAEVRFTDYDGNDSKITGSVINIDSSFIDDAYHEVVVQFEIPKWGKTYLRLNFKETLSYWLDDIGIVGLPADFETYYRMVFPQPLKLAAICTEPQKLVSKTDGLSKSALEVGQSDYGKVLARWQMNPGLSGDFILIALLEADGDIGSQPWAAVRAVWQSEGITLRQELCRLNIFDQYAWMGVPHIEYSRLNIPPDAMLELVAALDDKTTIRLRKLWLTPVSMWDF